MQSKLAFIIGNSDGIGLALTKQLLLDEWQIIGFSKSASQVEDSMYRHVVVDVTSDDFTHQFEKMLQVPPDVVVYCAGIGEEFNIGSIEFEQKVIQVNLIGAVKTIEAVLPVFIQKKNGQIIVISSLADQIISSDAPSYSASKAGLSNYVEGIALAARKYGVSITNVRFGFVDSKMSKSEKLPLMMTVEKSVEHLLKCIDKKPIRYSRPRIIAVIVLFIRWFIGLKLLFIRGISNRPDI